MTTKRKRPIGCFMLMTVTGNACSRILRASLFPRTTASFISFSRLLKKAVVSGGVCRCVQCSSCLVWADILTHTVANVISKTLFILLLSVFDFKVQKSALRFVCAIHCMCEFAIREVYPQGAGFRLFNDGIK